MNDATTPLPMRGRQPSSPGMRFFVAGAGMLVALGIVGGIMVYFKIEFFQKALLVAMILALLGVLNMVVGFLFELAWAIREGRFGGLVTYLSPSLHGAEK